MPMGDDWTQSNDEPPFCTVSLLRAKAADPPKEVVDANPCAQNPIRIRARDRAKPGDESARQSSAGTSVYGASPLNFRMAFLDQVLPTLTPT